MIGRKTVTIPLMSDTSSTDTAARLIERWLDEAARHAAGPDGTAQERGAAAQARRAWDDGGRFTSDAVRDLADWAERLGPDGRRAVRDWLDEQEYRL
jgi:hypothetical protein